jgi:hypothetical protein
VPAPEADVPTSALAPRLTISGPGLGGEVVEVLAEGDLSDGSLVFVSELPDGLPGNTVVVADQQLEVRHTLEFEAPPFIEATGWPNIAMLRLGQSVILLDAASGETSTLTAAGGGQLSVFGVRPGRRFVPAVEVGGDAAVYVVDLQERTLLPIAGTVRSGTPVFSPDGQWVVAVPEMGSRGADSLEIVRPPQPGVPMLRLEPMSDEVIEQWFYDASGRLWVTTRQIDPAAPRLVHVVDLEQQTIEALYDWDGATGHRLVAVTEERRILQERTTLDHVVIEPDGTVVVRIVDPVDDPKVHGTWAAYIDENDVVLVDLTSGELHHLRAIGSPTPSEIDFGDDGQFWIADGYAKGEIGLFRVDLRDGSFVDHRSAVEGLPEGEHFFSFDPTRFRTDGFSIVSYETDDQAWLVYLGADGASSTMELPAGHGVSDVSFSPTGDQAVVLSGDRSPDRRESIVGIVDLEGFTRDSFGDRLQGQRLAVWLAGQ